MFELEIFYLNHKKSFEFALHLLRKNGYKEIQITKKDGSLRTISIPPPIVKSLQRKLNQILQSEYTAPVCVHGFVASRNNISKTIITNAQQHIKKKNILNLDLENFFDTINFGRVRGLFLSAPFNLDKFTATKLAQLLTYNNKLPQGAPTSPIISNIICLKMDHQLMNLSKKHSITYTRYADDLTFSTNREKFNYKIIKKSIQRIIKNNGFKININKTREQSHKQRQIVTGLLVNEKINVSRRYKRQIRAMLHSWNKDGLAKAALKHFNSNNINNNDKFENILIKLIKYLCFYFKLRFCNKLNKYKNSKIKFKNNQLSKYKKSIEESYQSILLGKISFLGQVKGDNNLLYLNNLHKFYLLRDNYKLKNKNEIFESLNLTQYSKHEIDLIFKQIFNSHLIFTEGSTDILYIKYALQYFQKDNKFTTLNLRFCSLSGYKNLLNLHKAIYSTKMESSFIQNIRQNIKPLIPKNLSFSFVLDADDKEIVQYYNHIKQDNIYLLDFNNEGYIEKLFDKQLIINTILKDGYIINTKHKKLSDKSKTKLNEHLKYNSKSLDIYSVENFIVYQNHLIKKVDLANIIVHTENVNYNKFEDLFTYLTKHINQFNKLDF